MRRYYEFKKKEWLYIQFRVYYQYGKSIFQYSAIFASVFKEYFVFVKQMNNLRLSAS
jgi:hypothetical protein